MPQTSVIIDAMLEIDQTEDMELKALKYFSFISRTQIFIKQLKNFKGLLIDFYETGDDVRIVDFVEEFCIRRIRE